MSDVPRLVYFDIRGRAEPIRLLLEELSVAYENRFLDAEWLERKAETPFGVLPMWEQGDLQIPESQAILRHLARVHQLYGDREPEHVRCDVAAEALVDAKDLVGMFPWRANADADRDGFEGRELPAKLAQLEAYLATNPAGPAFFAGERLSYADLIAFSLLDDVHALYPQALDGCPALRELSSRVASRPPIRAYLRSDRRPKAIQYIGGGQRLFDERAAAAV